MNAQMHMLAMAYAVTAAAMFIGMWSMRADKRGYFRWPVYSAMAMFVAVVSWNALRARVLPPEWEVTRPGLLLVGALGVYALFGLGLGLLVGRLTRARKILEKDLGPEQEPEKESE